ncbi:ABC transporter permease subunit [Halorubrum sp. JWXQ-INN 858]|uniref:ABC transporter permease subunit n=1 Tax=Halorubrum sp. JWXQ-INN 858 TaxID=2690782 RepID=UPI0013F71D0E|nr:ABC transporter permease subunit [Halorubrum sp. JWXQ-INN 858]MWV64676.1 ABC transporter permease subunit [Halorubrum sp. JWXQ-INN 858]
MTAILLNESKGYQRSSLVLTGVFAMLAAVFLAVFPAMKDEADAIEAAYPDYMLELMGLEELSTIEGFAGGYVYPFVWILFAGMYFGYAGAGTVADDVRTRKMDLTLSYPVSRESVIVQKVAALWVPMAALNVGMLAVMAGGARLVGESFDPVALAMVHLLGVPYLLVCAGIGVVLSVGTDRPGRARTGALGLVFLLWLLDGLAALEPDYEWIAELTPSHYYDPTAILLHEEYAFLDAAVSLGAFLVLLVVATTVFVRRDI